MADANRASFIVPSLVTQEGADHCKTWTPDSGLDWTGLDWTGLDSLREHAHCERIGGPRFFCGDRDKSILFVLHFVHFLLLLPFFFCAHMDIIIISSQSEDSDYDKAVPGANR